MRTLQARQAVVCLLAALASTALGCAADDDNSTDAANPSESVGETAQAAVQSRPNAVVLNFDYQVQANGYWCGPTATRTVISARTSSPPSQSQLASDLGTTTNGTDSIKQVVTGLNKYIGGYEYRLMLNDPPLASEKSALWTDLTRSIDAGYGVVANIVAPASNHPPGYPNYTIWHYIAVMGYNADTSEVYIADSANFSGYKTYWLSFNQLATLIPPKGYAAWFPHGTTCTGGKGSVIGDIEKKYLSIGGCSSVLGVPLQDEAGTADKIGRYSLFQGGSIYWKESIGAHEVHGAIWAQWKAMNWEIGVLGYPITDETATSDGRGRKSEFEHGSIYWSASTGAHEVYGDIRARYNALGAEKSSLGLPTSGEYAVSGGRRNDFEHGSLTWTASTRAVTVTNK
jgi:hypothetical protein